MSKDPNRYGTAVMISQGQASLKKIRGVLKDKMTISQAVRNAKGQDKQEYVKIQPSRTELIQKFRHLNSTVDEGTKSKSSIIREAIAKKRKA